eukprot:6736866-Alexandrium_andersonii.AAC.1
MPQASFGKEVRKGLCGATDVQVVALGCPIIGHAGVGVNPSNDEVSLAEPWCEDTPELGPPICDLAPI